MKSGKTDHLIICPYRRWRRPRVSRRSEARAGWSAPASHANSSSPHPFLLPRCTLFPRTVYRFPRTLILAHSSLMFFLEARSFVRSSVPSPYICPPSSLTSLALLFVATQVSPAPAGAVCSRSLSTPLVLHPQSSTRTVGPRDGFLIAHSTASPSAAGWRLGRASCQPSRRTGRPARSLPYAHTHAASARPLHLVPTCSEALLTPRETSA